MQRGLSRLVYYSQTNLSCSTAAVEGDIRSILLASRRRNAADDLTGALIFNNGIFAQVLEGPRSAVEATFERIQRDDRHANVEVLDFAPISERAFPTWSMGFLGSSRRNEAVFADIGRATGFSLDSLRGERVFEIMLAIAREEEGRGH
jgi:hypothetical protein